MSKKSAKEAWELRKERVRTKISGTPNRLRLSVYRGNRNIYTQIIDDTKGVTLVAASSMSPEIRGKVKGFGIETAKQVGALLAQKAKALGIEKVVFDRSGYRYHGKIKALSEAAREGGLKF
ncbi:MAG: 50S ribosomal protein L18 [Methanotrichaceae archaeon]